MIICTGDEIVMTINMKETIAQGALSLLLDDKVKKLTVKDIVDKCQITRQTFYYHFADITELFRWILEKRTQQMLSQILSQTDGEEALRCFFVTAIQFVPYMQKSMNSTYRDEIELLLRKYIKQFFVAVAQKKGYYEYCSVGEVKVIIRYHSLAIFALLLEWNEQDTRNLDQIVHTIYRLLMEGIPPQL